MLRTPDSRESLSQTGTAAARKGADEYRYEDSAAEYRPALGNPQEDDGIVRRRGEHLHRGRCTDEYGNRSISDEYQIPDHDWIRHDRMRSAHQLHSRQRIQGRFLRNRLFRLRQVRREESIHALLIGIYSANFATKTYSSSVKFFVYAVETQQELSDSTLARNAASNTSKINYAMQMMETYTEMLNTSEFAKRVANDLNKKYNSNYTYKDISKCISIETKEDTAIMTMTVTTDDKATAFQIARQLEITVPKVMKNKNNGLLNASVEDAAIEASTPNGMGTVKKSILGFIGGGYEYGRYDPRY